MSTDDKPAEAPVFRLVSLGNHVKKAESVGAVQANAFSPEDEFMNFYAGRGNDSNVIEPPYNLRSLDRLSQENNALSPCIEAMVTNVDGTGYDFTKKGEDKESTADDTLIDEIKDFFDEPWPGMSFTTIRKQLRRDLERTGNAYLEVIQNANEEIVFLRPIDSKLMRLVALDEAVPVEKTVRRKGVDVKITVMQRERRFCQTLNGVNLLYFAEFGASRDLTKNLGRWAVKGQRLPLKDRATKVVHFTALPDANTPYGVPRWISQLPSILGSRKSEEYNLEFFENGGIPPVLILLQGGSLQPETKSALDLKMGKGAASTRNRVQVLEVMPTGGTFNTPNNARVTVERFGAERQDDSMFEKYDERCEIRVRRSFRLPPIFIGAADDYNFASAVASYTVAEAQVFRPERDEFDEIINVKLMSALGWGEDQMISKPLVIEDAALKLQGLDMAVTTKAVDMKDVIYEINEAVGTNVKFVEPPEEPKMVLDPITGLPAPDPGAPKLGPEDKGVANTKRPAAKRNGAGYTGAAVKDASLIALKAMQSLRKRDLTSLDVFLAVSKAMDQASREEFEASLAIASFGDITGVEADLAALSTATAGLISKGGCADHAHT